MRTARALGLAAGLVLLVCGPVVALSFPTTPPAGPPFPPPTSGVYVYDYAAVLSPETETTVQNMIVAITQRTAAGIVVYTQVKPGTTTEETVQDANDLIDEWGVGRKGFDDGLAILFNMDQSLCHGQVQLYAGPGFEAAFLSNSERQDIYENDMLPLLRDCDLDGALLAAMQKVDAAATPAHAQQLQTARQLDAIAGLVGSPLVFLLLVGIAAWSWLRYGRDPVYLDDPSVLMPAPPPDLTAAGAAVIWEGSTTRRALTTAMLDLASRGALSFVQEKHLLRDKMGIQINAAPVTDPNLLLNQRRPLSGAENFALRELAPDADDSSYISSDDLLKFGEHVKTFNEMLEQHLVSKGWFREAPSKVTQRWRGIGIVAVVAGVLAFFFADNVPSQGLLLVGIAAAAAGVVVIVISRFMPARTMAGAMIYAMLAAYRRTLQATMAQARSMNQVVEEAHLPWLETPDQAAVWGTALGLQQEVEDVISRSAEDAAAGVSTYHPWLPVWYWSGTSSSLGSGGGPSGIAPGLFSSSAVPDFGGMMSALGTIGNSPSSSGGGFGGGGGGGGGGGAGGGF